MRAERRAGPGRSLHAWVHGSGSVLLETRVNSHLAAAQSSVDKLWR